MSVSTGLVRVCTIDLEAEAPRLGLYLQLLSRQEVERAARFGVAAARTEFVVTRGVLRLLLAEASGVPPRALRIETPRPGGKPQLADLRSLQFSVSHAHGVSMVAYREGGAVGVDVELVDTPVDVDALAPRCLTAGEVGRFRELSPEDRRRAFVLAWTRKEAVLKAAGVGLSGDPRTVEVGLGAGDGLARCWPVGRWVVRDLEVGPRHCAALACEREASLAVRQHSWRAQGGSLRRGCPRAP